jgi:hypothetical protein
MSILSTKTTLTIQDNNIDIFTWYQRCKNYLNFWINGAPRKIDNITFVEGQLGFKIEGWSDTFFLNNKGELIVNGEHSDLYAIDSNGNLTTTIDFCGNTIPDPITVVKLGYMYNWYAISGQITSSDQWAIPLTTHVQTLFEYYDNSPVDGYYNAGGELKEVGTEYWNVSNATNASKLGLRGSGERGGFTGNFSGLKDYAMFHCLNLSAGKTQGFYVDTSDNYVWLTISSGTSGQKAGLAVRLVKTSTTLTHGQTGTYTGNDGKIYKTICIGTQEWLADNLSETKYRNGDPIPTVTGGTTWKGLTSGAKCAHNDDESNVLI